MKTVARTIAIALIGCACLKYGEGVGAAKAFFMAANKEGAEDIKYWVKKNIADYRRGGVLFGWGFNRCLGVITEAMKNYRM